MLDAVTGTDDSEQWNNVLLLRLLLPLPINSLYLFVNIILVPVPTHQLLHLSRLPLLFRHTAHP